MSSTAPLIENDVGIISESALRHLRTLVRGRIITPDDAAYHSARQVYNGRIDRRPDVIVSCSDMDDVVATLGFAREGNYPMAVRGGGHSAAGFGVCDKGLMLDLSAMRGVEVNVDARTADARAGATWGEFDQTTQAHGLATTGARISTTGVAGVTLGGGYGWLMRRCGLTVDNLLGAQVVTADGRIISASPTEHHELLWGLRGGGGNFGIVTSLKLRLHSIGPLVTCGVLYYPAEMIHELLRGFRQLMLAADDEVGALFNFLIAPHAPFVPPDLRGKKIVAIALCDTGADANAAARLEPFKRLGRPLFDTIKPRPYVRLQQLFDPAGSFGNHVFGRSGHLPALTDDLIDAIATNAKQITSPLSVVMISALGGAVARVDEQETAFGFRRTAFDVSINSVWPSSDAAEADRHIGWVNEFWPAVRPFCQGVYVNELGDEGPQRVRDAYNPQTHQALAQLKRRYDPKNWFHRNHNIKPSYPEESIC